MKQFLLPAGMKDLILEEVQVKKQLQAKLETIFEEWGYENVITPSIEYYETYQRGFGQVEEERMYKFFDRSGKIVVLKTDMTIPIARLAATKFREMNKPLRFCYCDKVYKVNPVLSGMHNEMSDCGIELIGADAAYDLEVLALANETMNSLDIDTWVMELGNANVFNEACKTTKLTSEQKQTLANLINEKQLPELELYIASLPLNEREENFFLQLPWLSGDMAVLEEAMTYAYNDGLQNEIIKMQVLCNQLTQLGYDNFIVDLGKMNYLNYYTGIIFEAYIEGVGTRILSGGRYDTLLAKFGKDMPALGFSLKIDALLSSMQVSNTKIKKELCYPSNKAMEAIQFRKQYKDEIISMRIDNTLEEMLIQEVV